MGHPDRLPINRGDYPYIPPDGGDEPKRVRLQNGTGAYEDARGNHWKYARVNNIAGNCEHWDVTAPNGHYANIKPDGMYHHGPDPKEVFGQ